MRIFTIILFLICGNLFAQSLSVNAYQYVIVPKTFDFQKRPNQYLINTVLSYELRQLGFETLYDDEISKELAQNPCKALRAKLRDESTMFSTKVVLDLLDCEGEVVISTEEGKSKIKDFEAGYREAIQKALSSWGDLGYAYDPSVLNSEATNKVDEVTESVKTEEEVPAVSGKEAISADNPASTLTVTQNPSSIKASAMLYAQEISGGFQLVNTKPEVVFVITKTGKPDTYLLKNREGMLYREGDVWVAEFYQDGNLVKEYYQIRF